ncbi:MAG: glycosyltransferase [Xanthomonadaceae bacterium]|nr:glycosyltransferase [Xanthomonadaceae bacterium]
MASRTCDTQDRPLRLLILTDSPIAVSGGGERFLRNLLDGLPPERYQATLVQLCEEPATAAVLHRHSIESVTSASFLPFRAVYKPDGLRAFLKLKRLVLREGFDIIQSQHENSDVFNALLPRGPLRAVRISNRRDTGFLKSARLRRLSRFLNRRYDSIVAPSTAILDAVERSEGSPSARTRCIPNGVNTERFRPIETGARLATRADMGYTNDELLVGCVADLFPVKRHVDLIDAFAQVHAALPNTRLILIGEGRLRETIEAQIRTLGLTDAIRLLGPRRDVDKLLPTLDLFVLASDTEGLSNAILEAQACGLPVVATRVGGNPDVVHADCGDLVEARRPAALAASMLRQLRDPVRRVRMGAAGRARVEREYSIAAMVQAYESLYRELADAR